MNARTFFIFCFVILVIGTVFRLPSVSWLLDVKPEVGFSSFHPDEERFVRAAKDFQSKRLNNYVLGMSTHVYVVKFLGERLFNTTPDLVVVIRLVSVVYGILTLLLIALLVRTFTSSSELALLTTAFLAVAPLHVMNSHFGTADAAATFYFYLAAFLGWYYVRNRSDLIFGSFVAAIGVCLGIKFFVSLFVPLGIVLLLEKNKIGRTVLALFGLLGSFSIVNFFNFTPWNLQNFLHMVMYDAVEITDGKNPIENVLLYLHGSLSYLGLGSALFLLPGLIIIGLKGYSFLNESINEYNYMELIKKLGRSPYTVFFSPFIIHFFLVVDTGFHAARFMLPFVPILCFVAAVGFSRFLSRTGNLKMIIGSIVVVFSYQCYNAVGLAQEFRNDIRYEAVRWMEQNVTGDENIASFSRYSSVKGVQLITGKISETSDVDSDFFITCDLEYRRYFRSSDAKEVFHAYGGQRRLKFYRDLFNNKLDYTVSRKFEEKNFALEQNLISNGFLQRLGTFTPKRLFVFKKTDKTSNIFADNFPDKAISPF